VFTSKRFKEFFFSKLIFGHIFLEFAFETPSPQPGSTMRGDGSHVPEGSLGEDQSTGRAWEA